MGSQVCSLELSLQHVARSLALCGRNRKGSRKDSIAETAGGKGLQKKYAVPKIEF